MFDLYQAQGLISVQNNRNLKPFILERDPSMEFSHFLTSAEAEIFLFRAQISSVLNNSVSNYNQCSIIHLHQMRSWPRCLQGATGSQNKTHN